MPVAVIPIPQLRTEVADIPVPYPQHPLAHHGSRLRLIADPHGADLAIWTHGPSMGMRSSPGDRISPPFPAQGCLQAIDRAEHDDRRAGVRTSEMAHGSARIGREF